jgi:hypothetical protein
MLSQQGRSRASSFRLGRRKLEHLPFQADCAGSIPVTRSIGMAYDVPAAAKPALQDGRRRRRSPRRRYTLARRSLSGSRDPSPPPPPTNSSRSARPRPSRAGAGASNPSPATASRPRRRETNTSTAARQR